MPYMTEEIWQHLPGERTPLILAAWPTSDDRFNDSAAEDAMRLLQELVIQVRNVLNEYEVDPGRRIQAIADGGRHSALIEHYAYVFALLFNVYRYDMWYVTRTPDL